MTDISMNLLNEWKEIQKFIGLKRSKIITWVKQGLPVHKESPSRQARVYAYKTKLTSWMKKHKGYDS